MLLISIGKSCLAALSVTYQEVMPSMARYNDRNQTRMKSFNLFQREVPITLNRLDAAPSLSLQCLLLRHSPWQVLYPNNPSLYLMYREVVHVVHFFKKVFCVHFVFSRQSRHSQYSMSVRTVSAFEMSTRPDLSRNLRLLFWPKTEIFP